MLNEEQSYEKKFFSIITTKINAAILNGKKDANKSASSGREELQGILYSNINNLQITTLRWTD